MKKIFLILLGFSLFLISTFASAYTFSSNGSASGAPGCTGNASGVYNCSSELRNSNVITINNTAGPVTINVNGRMRVEANINIASPNHAVTFNVSGEFRMDDNNNSIRASDGSTWYNNVRINVSGNTNIVTTGSVLADIRATGAGSITLGSNPTVHGSLTTSSGAISAPGIVNGSIVSTTGAITKNGGSVSEAIISTNGPIQLINQTTVKHITCDCTLTVGYGVTVTGNIQVANMTEDGASTGNGSQNNYNGSIYTTTGGVKLNFSSDVGGSIISATTVNLVDQNRVNSCVKSGSTSAGAITLGWGVNANSVCCGSSCSNSCVTNSSSFSMPTACTTEQVVISASGTVSYGTYPSMELWVNGTKLGSVSVTSAAKDYFFNVVLPTNITSLDIVFTNDATSADGGDRNLIVNSLTIRGRTLYPTDAGVIIDKGSGAAAFDGIDTVPGNTWVVWTAALRFGAISSSATNIAYYKFEESSWNGTLNEVKDTAGYSGGPFDGQSIGTPKPTPATTSPARAGSTGTCGYATFGGTANGGSAFTLDGLPTSSANGAKTSVSFWMYWDGSTSLKFLIGWDNYNLELTQNHIGFNTVNTDLYGTSATGLANQWVHIAAIFNDGDAESSKLYINGVLKTLSRIYPSAPPNNANANVTSTLHVGAVGGTTNFRFTNGRIDEIKVYNGEMTQAQVTADYNATHACPSIDATLIAYYNMDEASWNGTAGELNDSAGYSSGPFDGQGIGTPKPTANQASPARTGATGTCGYSTFSGNVLGGSAFTIPSLPVSATSGAKTSVSFWMYWDGNTWKMPIGWNKYNLVFGNSFFGFNTSNSDLYGMSSTGLANGWHHVVAVFNNGGVTSNKIYINGVNQSLSQLLGSPANQHAVVQSTLQVSGWTNPDWETTNYRFTDSRIDEVKIYNGEMTQAQVTADYNATHACPVYSVTPSSFNCVATGTTAATGHLYTQLAGTTFNIDVVALNSSNAVETSYVTSGTKNVTLEIVDGSGTTACASRTILSPAVSQTLTFSSSDAGRKSASVTISKAYKNLRCRVTDNNSTTVTACSSDNFVVRPSSFTVAATGSADADSTGVNTTATPKITASSNPNFTLTATTGIAGYDGTPQIDNTKLSAHTGAIQTGTLTGSFSAANSATGNTTASVGYSEVGYFRFAKDGVIDTSFTAVDSANGDCTTDSSNTLVGGEYGCYISNQSNTNFFGRFIPKYFNVDDASVTSSNACGSFSYYGQDGFNTQFILRAQNESGSRTRNYHGNFAKLDINTWTDNSASTGLKFLATNLPSGVNLLAGASSPTGSWSQGQATISATHKLSRPSSAVAPVNLILQTNPVDSDGVIVINNTPEAANIPANSLFRYGRLWMSNVYGSELLNLTVPIEAQYWSSNGVYQRNQLDSCTAIAPANIAMGSYKGNLTACETVISGGGTMAAGKTTMTLSKPGNGNNGSVDLSINLNSAAGSTCTSTTASSATSASLPQFGTTNPSARETFGLFKSPVIYMRENY